MALLILGKTVLDKSHNYRFSYLEPIKTRLDNYVLCPVICESVLELLYIVLFSKTL